MSFDYILTHFAWERFLKAIFFMKADLDVRVT